MTATVLPFRRPSIHVEPAVTVTPWWHCQPWCTTCTGGETYTWPNGSTAIMTRYHAGAVYTAVHPDTADSADVELAVAVQVAEFDDEGCIEPPAVTLDLDGVAVALTPAQAEQVAAALTAAAGIARQPLNPRPSVSPVADGRATTSGPGASPRCRPGRTNHSQIGTRA
ncbi:hypothetical protein GCM10010399_92730 [Dactylosporangium fulvum]|uniref:Uncharacterized protein n=1 Tax=Dactylosporangium fulvum TaxID=53359 RepID=A0ABY5WEF0_9ACTN|nr:hypothetical protein [Dactylosporangium fulvum]UWP87792.1 hypothetical protein Dfulv_16975 [Dactylosporangium fulvum]